MRNPLAALAVSSLLLLTACSQAPTVSAGSSPTPKTAVTSPSPTPVVLPTGSPCEIAQLALDKLGAAQLKYKTAYGSNNAATANAAKVDIQNQLKVIATELRAAAAVVTANEADLKPALLASADKIDAGAADATLFTVSKTEAAANAKFSAAALSWVPATLLEDCNREK